MNTSLRLSSVWAAAAVVCSVSLVACGADGQTAATAPTAKALLRVVSSVAPVTDIVRQVAGNRVALNGAIPEGVDSHTFRPQKDVAALLTAADVVFLNGVSLETPMIELARTVGVPADRTVLLGEAVLSPADYRYDFSFPRAGGRPNPHLWMNPLHGRAYARVIADELCRRDPGNCSAFRENLQAFEARIGVLDAAMRTAFTTIPGAKRLLTYHDAYAYFGPEYGWEVVGAVQPADFGRPSEAEVTRLVRQIRAARVKVLFGSEMFPDSVVRHLSTASGARYVTDLSDDDLPGEAGSENHTYVAMLISNYATITEQMGGDPAALRKVPTGAVHP